MKTLAAAALLTSLAMTIATPSAAAPTSAASAQLAKLLDEDLDAVYRRNPLQATVKGVPGYNDKLPEASLAQNEAERKRESALLAKLRALDAKSLEGQDRVSYQLLLDKTELAVESHRFRDAEALALSTLGGIQNFMPRASQVTPFKTPKDYDDYTARLKGMGAYADAVIERLRLGLKSGWMLPRPVLDRVVGAIDSHLVEDADKSVLLGPFKQPGAQRDAAKAAIASSYQPALKRVKAFIVDEYRPKAPAEMGVGAMKGGKEYYEFLIRQRVVRGYDAEKIHAIGLSEIQGLRREIGGIAKQVGFAGTTDEFIRDMRTNPKFFFSSAEDVLATYRGMQARVDPHLPKLFHEVPRMPYAVRAMTPAESASSTAANYTTGSLELGTPGYFTINANGFKDEANWRKETLFLHEAVPGHHMQIARASEMKGLHPWRTSGNWNVGYGEGWALYAERLGYDIGMYQDPYQRYGNLQARLFRAARLVVDTGIHHYGWSRDKAIDFMAEQGGVDHEFSVSEVDRYFSNPAQALGYLMGYLKFMDLRAHAEKALGPRFNAKDFHAVSIDNGSITLTVLEKLVDEWIARAKQ